MEAVPKLNKCYNYRTCNGIVKKYVPVELVPPQVNAEDDDETRERKMAYYKRCVMEDKVLRAERHCEKCYTISNNPARLKCYNYNCNRTIGNNYVHTYHTPDQYCDDEVEDEDEDLEIRETRIEDEQVAHVANGLFAMRMFCRMCCHKLAGSIHQKTHMDLYGMKNKCF